MQSKLFYIKYKLRENEELILGVLCILCFYTIVVSSLINNIVYFSVFFDAGEYWPSLVWRAGLLTISVFILVSCYKGIFLVYASALSHVGLLYYYNLFSLFSFATYDYFRILNFSLWWLSSLITLRYFYLTSQKGRPHKYFFANLTLFDFSFICMFIKSLLYLGG